MTNFYAWIIIGTWVFWGLYWLITALNTKKSRRVENSKSRLAHVIPLVIAVGILSVPAELGSFVNARFLPRTLLFTWIGIALLFIGIAFSIWARRHLGTNWSGTVTLKQNHELIRTGPYAIVRHPIYTGLLLAFLGTAIAMGEWRALVSVALCFIAFWRKIQLEEKWMLETFQDEYVRYKTKVKTLIPFIL